ncbi:MAG: TetR family transcriptional regulator [Archangium sp.]
MTRPPAKRARDSEATRAAILDAARQRFATEGYERTTIRAVAGDARIDPALVMRYFGNKEKLFAEAAEFDLRLTTFPAGPASRAGATMLEHFIERWEADDSFVALVRAAVTTEVAAKKIRAVFSTQILPAVKALSGDETTASLRAGLVASHLMGVAIARYVLRLPAVVAMSRAELVSNVGPTLQRYLTGPLARA